MMQILLLFSLLTSSWAQNIAVLGVNSRSKVVLGEINSEQYAQTLLVIKQGLDQQLPQTLSAMESQGSAWKLQKISVGVGVNGEIGIGPYKFGKALKQRFVYTRKK